MFPDYMEDLVLIGFFIFILIFWSFGGYYIYISQYGEVWGPLDRLVDTLGLFVSILFICISRNATATDNSASCRRDF
jgi:hypothetical protein